MSVLSGGVLILDYGSQYTLLIARRIRESGVYCEVWPGDDPRLDGDAPLDTRGIILSGGPASVYLDGLRLSQRVLSTDVPVLGICYGMQLLVSTLGGEVKSADVREYGRAVLEHAETGPLTGIPNGTVVWMSHGDEVTKLPEGFLPLAHTTDGVLAAMMGPNERIFGLQFHPEVSHTAEGEQMLRTFVDGCEIERTWSMNSFVDSAVETIRKQVGDKKVICGLSGGVDSAVVAALLHRAIGDQLYCVMVDNGLLRAREVSDVRDIFEAHFGANLIVESADALFLDALAGVTDPEQKRKTIGEKFIRVFEKSAERIEDVAFLAQGTLYPDVIESVSIKGPSATIKSHHNVGGLPENLGFELVEPLRELFKDEVRELGRELGLPESFIGRHPFPGPGLAVRILGEVTPERCATVRAADDIFITALREHGYYDEIWQAFAVLLPVKTVGVMGDQRTYDDVIALRAVTSRDGMTADRGDLPISFLGSVSDAIINRVDGVNRVVYDVTSKPPATIEWE